MQAMLHEDFYLIKAADGVTNLKLFQECSLTCVQNLTSIVTNISPYKTDNTESINETLWLNNNKLNTCLKHEFIHHTFVINSIVGNMRF